MRAREGLVLVALSSQNVDPGEIAVLFTHAFFATELLVEIQGF